MVFVVVLIMTASHPEMFQPSTVDESALLKLVGNHLLPTRAVLQWRPVKDEDIPTSNTDKIIVMTSFVQRRFGLSSCEFLCGLLHHYKIELIHLNPNSILQIVVFAHLCETYLAVHPKFPLFKHYFLKYQPNTDKHQIIGGVAIQTCQRRNFLNPPLKSSLKGCHKQSFYCKTHEPNLPPFVGRLPEYDATWVEEPTDSKMAIVSALASRVNELKKLT
jgi:hypothetical protein